MIQNVVVKKDGKWYVYSEDRSRKLGGPYDTEDEAKKRLKQVEHFKNNSFETITFNLQAPIRHDQMEGREYVVVPMIMMAVGVHAGSNGPLFYPPEELGKTPVMWNHKPIVVYHPMMHGEPVTACDPDIITNRKIGVIMNAMFEDNKLKAEAWLEESRIKKVDDRITEALEMNEMIELSTGVFTDNDPTEGVWNGEKYLAIARNHRPDHLAVLPDQVGACSIADGAGLLRLNQESFTEQDYRAIGQGLVTLVRGKGQGQGGPKQGDGGTDTCTCTKCGETVTHERGTPCTEIKCPKCGSAMTGISSTNVKELEMDKKKVVDDLIKNTKWVEADREFLMNLDDEKLEKMLVKNEEPKKEDPKKGAKKEDPKPAVQKEDPKKETTEPAKNAAKKKEMTAEEYIANAPEGIRDMLNSGVKAHEAQKAELIKVITANKVNQFTEEQLKAKSLDELQGIAVLAFEPSEDAPETSHAPQALYAAMAAPATNENKEEPLVAPVLNFSEEKK